MERVEKIEASIVELERKLHQMNKVLDEQLKNISFFVLSKFARSWIEAEVRRKIEANAVLISKVGVEKLRELKTDLLMLTKNLAQLAEDAIADERRQLHNEKIKRNVENVSHAIKNYLESAFRVLVSNLGALLEKYGLISDPTSSVISWESDDGGVFRYQLKLEVDLQKNSYVLNYEKSLKEQWEMSSELAVKREELIRARAGELWDSIFLERS